MHYNLEYDVPCLADVAVNQMLDKDFFVWMYEEERNMFYSPLREDPDLYDLAYFDNPF
jgi:hypothetical protein